MTAGRSPLLQHAAVVLVQLFALACAQAGSLRHDVFARPAIGSMRAAGTESGGSSGTAQPKPAWNPALRAVIVAGRESRANVGGTIVRIGGDIDGYRLVEVREREAVFVKDKQRYTLTLARIKGPDAGRDPPAPGAAPDAGAQAQDAGGGKAPPAVPEAQDAGGAKTPAAAPGAQGTGGMQGLDTTRRSP